MGKISGNLKQAVWGDGKTGLNTRATKTVAGYWPKRKYFIAWHMWMAGGVTSLRHINRIHVCKLCEISSCHTHKRVKNALIQGWETCSRITTFACTHEQMQSCRPSTHQSNKGHWGGADSLHDLPMARVVCRNRYSPGPAHLSPRHWRLHGCLFFLQCTYTAGSLLKQHATKSLKHRTHCHANTNQSRWSCNLVWSD